MTKGYSKLYELEAEVKSEAEGKMKDEDLFDEAKDEPGFPKSVEGETTENSLTGADPLKRITIYPTSLV